MKTPPWEQDQASEQDQQLSERAVATPPGTDATIHGVTASGSPYVKDAKGRFIKGPGRRKGSKNQVTTAIEILLEGEAESLTRRCIELALKGDPTALKICFDRIAPVRRGRVIPKLTKAENESSVEALLRSVLDGEVTPEEGKEIVGLIESAARVAATQALGQVRFKQVEALEDGPGLKGAGVMLVPVTDSLEDWETISAQAQLKLKQTVRS